MQEEAITAALPLNDILPASWAPLGDVQPVNIDGDRAAEYLLFFTYDGNGGPIGAVIYNPETDIILGDTTNSTQDDPNNEPAEDEPSAPNRPATSLIPYPILPSYRPGAGQGFIAEPAQANAITVHPLTLGATPTTLTATDEPRLANALAILGGTTYLTFVWWLEDRNDYGVTQLYAPSHFEATSFVPFNWEAWRTTPRFINEIIAVHPVHDRSLLCRRKRYILTAPTAARSAAVSATTTSGIDDAPPGTDSVATIEQIAYHEMDMGLNFCNGAPATPFYPEAVALAYLVNGTDALLDSDLSNKAITLIQETVARADIIRVNDLAGYQTTPYPSPTVANNIIAPQRDNRGVPTEVTYTTVCAEVLLPGQYIGLDAQAIRAPDVIATDTEAMLRDAAGQFLFARRWLLFTLRHVQPTLEPPTADRLFITNVEAIPVPDGQIAVNCKEWLGR